MTDDSKPKKSGFLSHAAVYGVGYVALQVVGIVLLPLYLEKLTPTEYGILQLLYRIGEVINICLMVNGIRLGVLSVWGRANSKAEQKSLAPSVVLFTATFLLISGLIVFLTSGILTNWLDEVDDWRLLACGIFAMMLHASTILPLALMQARYESTAFVKSTVGIAIGQITLVAIALVVLDAGIWGVILAFGLNNLIFGCVLNLRELSRDPHRPNGNQIMQLVRFSLPFIPTGLCFFILNSGDAFFLVEYHGAAAYGVYAIAYKIANLVVTLSTQPLVQVWNVWMYEAYRQADRAAVFGRASTRILSSLAFGGTLAVIFKDEVFSIIGDGQYRAAAGYITPLILAHFLLRLSNLCDGAFYVTQKTKFKPFIAAASTAVMLLAYWLLIRPFGGLGAAWATLLGFAFHMVASWIVSRHVFRIEFEWDRLAGLLAVSAAVCSCSILLGTGLEALPGKIVLAAAWPASIWATGLLSPTERQYIWNIAKQLRSYAPN